MSTLGPRAALPVVPRACRYVIGAKDLEIRKFGPKRVIENPAHRRWSELFLAPIAWHAHAKAASGDFSPCYVTLGAASIESLTHRQAARAPGRALELVFSVCVWRLTFCAPFPPRF